MGFYKGDGDEAPATLAARYYLAVSYIDADKPAEAQTRLEELLPDHAPGSRSQASVHPVSHERVGGGFSRQKGWPRRNTLLEEVLPLQRQVLGAKDADTLQTVCNLAIGYRLQGRLTEAQKLFRGSVDRTPPGARAGTPGHTSEHASTLPRTLLRQGKLAEAGQLWRELLPIDRRELGPTNATTIETFNSLIDVLGAKGEWLQALELLQELIAIQPEDHWHYYRAHAAALAAGQTDRGRKLSADMLARFADSKDPAVCERVAKSFSSVWAANPTSRPLSQSLTGLTTRSPIPVVCTIKGIAEYRLAHYAEAEALLEQARNDPDPDVGCLAAYFCALARQQRGQSAAASLLLEVANHASRKC